MVNHFLFIIFKHLWNVRSTREIQGYGYKYVYDPCEILT